VRWPVRIVAGVVLFVAAVNLIWFAAPTLGDANVWRPLGSILVVVLAAAAWAKMRPERR
jgi:hypothetical protein